MCRSCRCRRRAAANRPCSARASPAARDSHASSGSKVASITVPGMNVGGLTGSNPVSAAMNVTRSDLAGSARRGGTSMHSSRTRARREHHRGPCSAPARRSSGYRKTHGWQSYYPAGIGRAPVVTRDSSFVKLAPCRKTDLPASSHARVPAVRIRLSHNAYAVHALSLGSTPKCPAGFANFGG